MDGQGPLTDERWRQVANLYQEAQSQAPAARDAFVRQRAGGDSALQREVQALLDEDGQPAILDRSLESTIHSVLTDNCPVQPGTVLGVYQIDSLLGVGGMGEVYRARDTKLNRDVAIKILPPAFANDPDRLARFKREAQVLASLNHPNIAAIYGFEDSGAVHALVLELVEGETLADLLAGLPKGSPLPKRISPKASVGDDRRPKRLSPKAGAAVGQAVPRGLPVDEALAIARQIADALEAAHEQGIIHRDLKPANIKVREDGTVKVLDFGLAKLTDPVPPGLQGGPSVTQSPTITTPAMTAAGMILGTAAYMSPEQAKGRPADKRSDIWAFGCVLYEILTGKRAFDGDDVSEALASVLRSEPDWSALPQVTSPMLRRVLQRCLDKDRRTRIPDVAAIRFLLDEPMPAAAAAEVPPVDRAPLRTAVIATGAIVLAALVGTAAWRFKPLPDPVPPSPVSFAFSPAEGPISTPSPFRDVAISPDGRTIVYAAGGTEGASRLYVRGLDDLEPRPLTDVASGAPFFSPDGHWIGFVSVPQRELRKIPVSGGLSTRVCSFDGVFFGGTWLADGRIVFAAGFNGSALYIVSAVGGNTEQLTKQPTGPGQPRYGLPARLPDGHNILVAVSTGALSGTSGTRRVGVFNVDTRSEKMVVDDGTQAEYVDGGFLVYAAQGALRAARFDARALVAQRDSAVLVERLVTKSATGAMDFAVSGNGNLVYVRGTGNTNAQRSLTWVDRTTGRETPIPAPMRPYAYARLSPDGSRIALDIRDQDADLWLWDTRREKIEQLTRTPALETSPVWTGDGQRIIFGSTRDGGAATLYALRIDGGGTAEPLAPGGTVNQVPSALSPDGRFLLFTQQGDGGNDAMTLRLDGDHRVEPLLQTAFNEQNAVLSPDGTLVAYQSNEFGRDEIYVRPYPEVNRARYSISSGGGSRPLWAPDGKALFYVDVDGFLTSVPIQRVPQFDSGKATRLFQTRYYAGGPAINARTYDISSDGKRFLMIKEGTSAEPTRGTSASAASASSVIVLVNGIETLRAKLTALSGTDRP